MDYVKLFSHILDETSLYGLRKRIEFHDYTSQESFIKLDWQQKGLHVKIANIAIAEQISDLYEGYRYMEFLKDTCYNIADLYRPMLYVVSKLDSKINITNVNYSNTVTKVLLEKLFGICVSYILKNNNDGVISIRKDYEFAEKYHEIRVTNMASVKRQALITTIEERHLAMVLAVLVKDNPDLYISYDN